MDSIEGIVGKFYQLRVQSDEINKMKKEFDVENMKPWTVDSMNGGTVEYFEQQMNIAVDRLRNPNADEDAKKNAKKQSIGFVSNVQHDLRRIDVEAIEFDWFFKGERGQKFITVLANTPSLEYFAIPTVKASIEF